MLAVQRICNSTQSSAQPPRLQNEVRTTPGFLGIQYGDSLVVQSHPSGKLIFSSMGQMYLSGMRMVAIGWVVVIASGISSFIFLKRYVDKKRLELIKAKGQERLLEAQKEPNNKS